MAFSGMMEEIAKLLREWDPIGVAAELPDEYDAYVAGIHGLLRRDATAEQLAEHLSTIVRDEMGLRVNVEREQSIAERLVALRH